MDIVADTSIFLSVALDEPEKDRIVQLTAGASVVAPETLPYEIGNALSAMVKRRRLSETEAFEAERSASLIPVRLVGVDVQASLRLAVEYAIDAYDAYFLQCARTYSPALLTLDRRMRQVAGRLGMTVLE